MSRKRPRQDSLELFLDAICNMFGGFLFLMLSVVVTIRSTTEAQLERAPSSSNVTAAEFEELEAERDDLLAQLNDLNERVNAASEFAERLVDPKVVELYQEALDAQEEFRKTSNANLAANRAFEKASARAKELEEENKTLQTSLQNAREETKDVRDKVDKNKRARKVSPPKLRQSSQLLRASFVLRYGKVYLWEKGGVFNSEDFVASSRSNGIVKTSPRLDRGIDLNAPDYEKSLDDLTADLNPSRYCFDVIVCLDSYAEFGNFRDYLKKRGYDFFPWLGPKGGGVVNHGGSESRVQ